MVPLCSFVHVFKVCFHLVDTISCVKRVTTWLVIECQSVFPSMYLSIYEYVNMCIKVHVGLRLELELGLLYMAQVWCALESILPCLFVKPNAHVLNIYFLLILLNMYFLFF